MVLPFWSLSSYCTIRISSILQARPFVLLWRVDKRLRSCFSFFVKCIRGRWVCLFAIGQGVSIDHWFWGCDMWRLRELLLELVHTKVRMGIRCDLYKACCCIWILPFWVLEPKTLGCWCRKWIDTFEFRGLCILFLHLFGGGRQLSLRVWFVGLYIVLSRIVNRIGVFD